MELKQYQQFFMLGTFINIGFLLFTTVMVILLKKLVYKIHGKLFNLSEESINKAIYNYLAVYKIITITLFLVPWIAISLMK